MSVKVMAAVWELKLSPAHLIVLLALADHADDLGRNAFPSVGRLAWKTGYSDSQVRRILKQLTSSGVIERVDRAGRTTMYAIKTDKGIQKEPFSAVKMKGLQNDTPTIAMTTHPCHSYDNPTPVIAMTDEPSEEPKKKQSAADAAHVDTSSVGSPEPVAKKTPTPQTPRPRDFMFDAVAEHVFEIDPAEANGSGARIAKISRWLTQSYKGKDAAKVGTISKAAKPEHVAMFAKWYHGKYNASIPRDLEKFVEHWRAFATEMRGKQSTPAITQAELDTLAKQQSAALLEADYE